MNNERYVYVNPEFEHHTPDCIWKIVVFRRTNQRPALFDGDGKFQPIERAEAARLLRMFHNARHAMHADGQAVFAPEPDAGPVELPPDDKIVYDPNGVQNPCLNLSRSAADRKARAKHVVGGAVYVIPLKRGLWRTVVMSAARADRWNKAYRNWFDRIGYRLAISPEMWIL